MTGNQKRILEAHKKGPIDKIIALPELEQEMRSMARKIGASFSIHQDTRYPWITQSKTVTETRIT